jgi:hypothetical protein
MPPMCAGSSYSHLEVLDVELVRMGPALGLLWQLCSFRDKSSAQMPSETGLWGTECCLVFLQLGKDLDSKWMNWMAKLECTLDSKKGVLKGNSALVGMSN